MIVISTAEGQLKCTSYLFSREAEANAFCAYLKSKCIPYHDSRPIKLPPGTDACKFMAGR